MNIRTGTRNCYRYGFPDDEAPIPSDYQPVHNMPRILHDPSGDFRPGAEFRRVELNYMLNQHALAVGTVIRIRDTVYTVQVYSWTRRIKRFYRDKFKFVTKVHSRLTLIDCDGHEWRGRQESINNKLKDLA